ncbi:hypothetical protein LINPERPRIM_LOCUS5261 [Linum perenne]
MIFALLLYTKFNCYCLNKANDQDPHIKSHALCVPLALMNVSALMYKVWFKISSIDRELKVKLRVYALIRRPY